MQIDYIKSEYSFPPSQVLNCTVVSSLVLQQCQLINLHCFGCTRAITLLEMNVPRMPVFYCFLLVLLDA